MSQLEPLASKGAIPVWKKIDTSQFTAGTHNPKITIVGAGISGLTLALDLAQKGHQVTVLSKWDFIPKGSKAICFSKRSLDIFQRLGVASQILAQAVTWNIGEVYWKDDPAPVYTFDMLPIKSQQNPGFVNIQQYYLEDILIKAVQQQPNIDMRWGHHVLDIRTGETDTTLQVEADGRHYTLTTEWLIACDGNKSTIRQQMGLEFEGRVFEENFLIADIKLAQPAENKRRFWFDPPFNPGMSALMHKQPDGVWRLDFQLGWDIDREQALRKENVDKYVRALLGDGVAYEEEWYSIYTFQCRRMRSFLHGKVIFAGDSAHLVSPFGARGCNGGLADVDNLAWKLDHILRGVAAPSLLETYNHEAVVTADENILNSTRSTNFLTPKTPQSTALRDAVLELAKDHAFARPFVNSGRLSTAVSYPNTPLRVADGAAWSGGIAPGQPALDAPLGEGWLLHALGGRKFTVLHRGWDVAESNLFNSVNLDALDLPETQRALIAQRYALQPGAGYLIRPDQYVAARYTQPQDAATLTATLSELLQSPVYA